MNRYRINSVHTFYEFSYTEGEGRFVNERDQDANISAETVEEAIELYYKKVLYTDFKPEQTEVDMNCIYDDRLVDQDMTAPSKSQIEEWKKGELTLYAENITIHVNVLEPVNLEEEL